MRKKMLLAVLSMMMMTVTGCVENIELDEEQEDKFVQYSVYSVLQHDKNYLVELEAVDEVIPPIQEEASTEEPTSEKPSEGDDINGGQNGDVNIGEGITVGSLSEAIGIDGVSFTYKGYKVCDSYPESDGSPAFVIKAVQGSKLVVLEFDMINTTGSELRVDIASKDIRFKGIFNNSIKTNALLTLLPEAINTYISILPAGGTASTVLVFEMSDGYVNNLSEITIDVIEGSETRSVKIQ